MPLFRFVFFLLVFLTGINAYSQSKPEMSRVRDLKSEWMTFRDGAYASAGDAAARTVYFSIDPSSYRGDFIALRSVKAMDVFVNGQLADRTPEGTLLLSIDSLARRYSSPLSFGIYQREGTALLTTEILAVKLPGSDDGERIVREPNSFLNFSILAVLLLSGFFVFLFRSNPKLTLDYLNVTKLISVQEREDNLLATRITSSVNLLFYLYVSASCALALLAIFHFSGGHIPAAHAFPIRSTGEGFVQWIKLILLIAGFLGLKLVVIYAFSSLFHLRDTSALQFFNFIRMLFFIVGIILLVVAGCFIYNGYLTGPDTGLLKMSLLLLAFSVVMIFLKLLSFTSFRFVHLFSYLCASEIIPLVVLLRILLY